MDETGHPFGMGGGAFFFAACLEVCFFCDADVDTAVFFLPVPVVDDDFVGAFFLMVDFAEVRFADVGCLALLDAVAVLAIVCVWWRLMRCYDVLCLCGCIGLVDQVDQDGEGENQRFSLVGK